MLVEAVVTCFVFLLGAVVAMFIRIEHRLTVLEGLVKRFIQDETGCPQHLDHPKK